MKRNMDLVRKILLALEEKEEFEEPIVPEIPGVSTNEIYYHIKLLNEAGLIEAKDWSTDDGPEWLATSLTSPGHDFLDAARNDTFWMKAKSLVQNGGGALTLEAMKVALAQVVTNALQHGS